MREQQKNTSRRSVTPPNFRCRPTRAERIGSGNESENFGVAAFSTATGSPLPSNPFVFLFDAVGQLRLNVKKSPYYLCNVSATMSATINI